MFHILVKIQTSRKRKHELTSEVTSLVRDTTIIKPNMDENQSQSTVEESSMDEKTLEYDEISQNCTIKSVRSQSQEHGVDLVEGIYFG